MFYMSILSLAALRVKEQLVTNVNAGLLPPWRVKYRDIVKGLLDSCHDLVRLEPLPKGWTWLIMTVGVRGQYARPTMR